MGDVHSVIFVGDYVAPSTKSTRREDGDKRSSSSKPRSYFVDDDEEEEEGAGADDYHREHVVRHDGGDAGKLLHGGTRSHQLLTRLTQQPEGYAECYPGLEEMQDAIGMYFAIEVAAFHFTIVSLQMTVMTKLITQKWTWVIRKVQSEDGILTQQKSTVST